MSDGTPPEPPGKSALVAATEFLKYTLTLGTGAFVLSAGLITNKIALSRLGIVMLIISWVALAASILSGVLAYSRIPVLLSEANYDLEDKLLTYPWRVHQIAFMLAIVCLGVVLISTLSSLGSAQPAVHPTLTTTIGAPLMPAVTPTVVPISTQDMTQVVVTATP